MAARIILEYPEPSGSHLTVIRQGPQSYAATVANPNKLTIYEHEGAKTVKEAVEGAARAASVAEDVMPRLIEVAEAIDEAEEVIVRRRASR